MPTITRRGFLALGGSGAAAAALAACGSEEDPRDEGRDGELLGESLAAEETLEGAYTDALGEAANDDRRLLEDASTASADRVGELETLAEEADAAPVESEGAQPTGLTGAIAAGGLAIAAYREAAGLLSTPELRRTAAAGLAAVAAEQAALRASGGDEPLVPEPFVTGSNEKPLTAPDDTDTEEE